MDASISTNAERKPLGIKQALRLLGHAVLGIIFASIFLGFLPIFIPGALQDIEHYPDAARTFIFLAIALVTVMLVGGATLIYLALPYIRDLLLGSTLVTTDVIHKAWVEEKSVRNKTYYEYYISLGQIDRLHVQPSMYPFIQVGKRCRVTYSPHTKIMWDFLNVPSE